MTSERSLMIRDANMRDPIEVRSCICGYRVNNGCDRVFYSVNQTDVPKYECRVTQALRNHMIFPSFELLIDESELINESEIQFKNRHYAFMLQITRDISLTRPGYFGHSQFGEPAQIYFYLNTNETPKTFSWSDFKLGATLVILYAKKKVFLDGQIGIRQEILDNCFVFNASIKVLEKEASKLLESKDAKELKNIEKCFSCGLEKENLSRCAKCKLAIYCSKECQKESWLSNHKDLCSQFNVLLRLSVLQRQQFQKKFNFDKNSENFLSE